MGCKRPLSGYEWRTLETYSIHMGLGAIVYKQVHFIYTMKIKSTLSNNRMRENNYHIDLVKAISEHNWRIKPCVLLTKHPICVSFFQWFFFSFMVSYSLGCYIKVVKKNHYTSRNVMWLLMKKLCKHFFQSS